MSFLFDDQYPVGYTEEQFKVSKQLNMVVCIEGLEQCFSISPTYTYVRYGDPGIDYGDPNLVYGGLRLDDSVVVALSLDSNLVISQRLEPEQGRAAVTTMSLVFVDFAEYFSKLISPDQLLNDPLGNKLVKVYLGYQNKSFPEDYFIVFRGYISSTRSQSGKITLQLSDANLKRRQPVFGDQKTKTTASINASQTTINVQDTTGFIQRVLGPTGVYDSSLKTYIKIEDEYMEYSPTGIVSQTQFQVTRGQLGSTAASHGADADVAQFVSVEGNIIDIALKMMLSGWGGPFVTGVALQGIQNLQDYGTEPNAIRLLDGTNGNEEYNITPGDQVTITGSANGNDGVYYVESVQSSDKQTGNIIFFTQDLPGSEEYPTSATISIRSQYDVWPEKCGSKMKPAEIDMAGWEGLRDTFYPDNYSSMSFVIGEKVAGKEFIEKELLLPAGAYSLTRFGRLSAKITLPPIAGQKIVLLNHTNVIGVENIVVERALNTRRFYNEVSYKYDLDPNFNEYLSVTTKLDTDSLNVIGLSSVLPIESRGMKTSLDANKLIENRGIYLLRRYKNAAFELQNVKTNWGTGSLIEAGDVVIVEDNGQLQITNLNTGARNLENALFEVIDRQIDVKTGLVTLKLLSNVGYEVDDRFGVISPTSQIAATGSTNSVILIEDSYGVAYPGDEQEKWSAIIGEKVYIHKKDYSDGYVVTLVRFLASDRYKMEVSPALPIVPDDTWVVDVDEYPNTTFAFENQKLKLLYNFIDPTVEILSGVSNSIFVVSIADAAKFTVGLPVFVHNSDYSIESAEFKVKSINVNQIELDGDLGFTPSAGQFADLIGFIDGGGPFRLL